MSKTMDLLSPEISESATKYLEFFECDITDGFPHSCKIVESNDLNSYALLANFVDGSQMSTDMAYSLIEYFSHKIPEDELARLKWCTKEVQRQVSLDFYPEYELMLWGINDGVKWIDRSLRVANEIEFNHQMHDKNGHLRLKNVLVHANHQYIYHCVLDVLVFLNEYRP